MTASVISRQKVRGASSYFATFPASRRCARSPFFVPLSVEANSHYHPRKGRRATYKEHKLAWPACEKPRRKARSWQPRDARASDEALLSDTSHSPPHSSSLHSKLMSFIYFRAGTPTITVEGSGLDMDSISVVSSVAPPHIYQCKCPRA